jgi:chromosome segregation protein
LLLRKLEAYGFKSFADKTELDFGEGITVIVGPNGSGKSNISDAIRWVLGEQSVRNLRGTKMEDVIFAGSSGRRPLGIAEVSLIFDNSDGALNIDFNEVIITRRVFRSGESEYFINKSLCRLKDIYDLLADTGLGRDAMTVIGQNKVDEVLNSKPEDRRLLFEEAAGITKYKQRKKDALRKLEDTTNNLTRVLDITAEIETQLQPLAKSAEKTRQFNQLHSELTSCQVTLLVNKHAKAHKMVESATQQQEALTDEELQVNTALLTKETTTEDFSQQLILAEERLITLDTNRRQTETELERLNGKIAVLDERILQSNRSHERIREEALRLTRQFEEYTGKISDISSTRHEKEAHWELFKGDLDGKTDAYQELQTQIDTIQTQLESYKEKSFDHIQEIVNERNKLTNAERELSRLESSRTSLEAEQAEYEHQLAQAHAACQDTLQEQKRLTESIVACCRDRDKISGEKTAKESKLRDLAATEQQLVNQLHELNSRHKVLSNMQQDLEGFTRGIKSILKSNASWSPGICGAVAQLLHVPDTYVTALEVALGGALQFIVTETDQVAKQAIHFLKEHNLGRATFLPLNTIKLKKPRENEVTAAHMEGALGFASELVRCDARFSNVIEFLLGRTIVAKNIDAALKIARQNSFSLKIVTLDGELLNPGGSLTGGSMNKKDTGILSRGNEIENIEIKLADLKERTTIHQTAVACCRNELSAIEEQISVFAKLQQDIEIKQAELGVYVQKLKLDIQRLTLAGTTLAAELNNCSQEIRTSRDTIEKTRQTIDAMENRDLLHKRSLEEWQNQLADFNLKKEQLQMELTNLKVEVMSFEKEIAAIDSSLQHFCQLKDSLKEQLSASQREETDLNANIADFTLQLAKAKEDSGHLLTRKDQYEQEHRIGYEKKLEILSALQKTEKEMKELRRKQTDIQGRLHESELLYTKYSYEATNCTEQLQQNYSLSLAAAQQICRQESTDSLLALIKRLEQDIAALGPINQAAIEEYAKLKERYEFLQEQYSDLIAAKEYLSSIIHDIDGTMASKFAIAFKEINAYFSDIFAKLFGGGRAELKLLEPDRILECGIEIIVQPPGKKLQNLVLLSGGERALTVVALLFSFLTYKPAPFIVVDEIDAALDEANVERFSHFLQDYARNTQFIVVTHRKGTMEAANVIHGVTIEESGVSRLVSVKLMDKAG